jgi:hypothetical protein
MNKNTHVTNRITTKTAKSKVKGSCSIKELELPVVAALAVGTGGVTVGASPAADAIAVPAYVKCDGGSKSDREHVTVLRNPLSF